MGGAEVPVTGGPPGCGVGGGGGGCSSLPGVFAWTSMSLCNCGFKATIMGSKGRSSSTSCSHISEEGRAGWCLTLNKVVLSGRVLLGCGVSSSALSPKYINNATNSTRLRLVLLRASLVLLIPNSTANRAITC